MTASIRIEVPATPAVRAYQRATALFERKTNGVSLSELQFWNARFAEAVERICEEHETTAEAVATAWLEWCDAVDLARAEYLVR